MEIAFGTKEKVILFLFFQISAFIKFSAVSFYKYKHIFKIKWCQMNKIYVKVVGPEKSKSFEKLVKLEKY